MAWVYGLIYISPCPDRVHPQFGVFIPYCAEVDGLEQGTGAVHQHVS